jgi:competence protein ComGC
MLRLLLFVSGLFLLALPAVAHDGDRLLCDGKYAAAQDMLDAAYGKYGTIYTGDPDSYY